ncbi:sulfite exporter TauE/SafE [Aureococcus anophagefferens]|nr:sulfite exporter TauE/SafE [Aureococcus anophagefferens]
MAQRRHPVDDVMHVREPTDCKAFCLKYFCEGQRLEASLEEKLQADKVEWTVKYRKQRAPASPHVAKQFSYMIQSVGMTAAAFVILYMQVRVEWKSITYCSVGGVVGLIYGLEEIAPVLTPPYAKMYFVVIWGSFAASLYYLNRIHGRKIWKSADLTPYWWANLVLNWKALVLLAAGFIGGIFTSFAGSGIDICSFSVLTLLFRVSEKTATPTSVVLMAINTVVAMCYCKWMMREGLEALAWDFFAVCAPIVVVGAPLGSVVGSHVHRLVLATCVYVTDFVQLVGALIVVRPWTHRKCNKDGDRVQHGSAGRWRGTNCEPVHLCWTSAVLFVSGLVAFYIFQLVGEKLMERNARIEKEVLGDPDDVEKAAEAPAVAAVVGAEPLEGAFLKES